MLKQRRKVRLQRQRMRAVRAVRAWRGVEALERRAMLDGSPFGLASFTPLGDSPSVIFGPGGLNGAPQFDINKDGLGDMVVLYGNGTGASGDGTAAVSAVLPRADGSATEYHIAQYTIPSTAPLPVVDQVVVSAENGNGHPIVAVVHNDGSGVTSHKFIDVFFGQPDGTFAQPNISLDMGTSVFTPSVQLFDANGDGKTDAFVSNTTTTFTVFLGNGDGTFSAAVNTAIPFNKLTTVSGFSASQDMTGDGIADLVVSGGTLTFVGGVRQLGLFIFKGQATGKYNLTPSFSDTTDLLTLQSVREMTGDTKPDVIAYGPAIATSQGQPASLFVFRNTGSSLTKSFQSATFADGLAEEFNSVVDPNRPLIITDINGDGKLDMILTEGPATDATVTIHAAIGNGNGGFTQSQQFSFANQDSISSVLPLRLMDIDNDGFPDMVLFEFPGDGSVKTAIRFNHGDGTFDTTDFIPTPSVGVGTFPGIADFNGDGKLDLLFQGSPALLQPNLAEVLLNDTGRTFKTGVDTAIGNGVNLSHEVQRAPADPLLDYNGDGMADLLSYFGDGGGDFSTGGLDILASTGDGHFASLLPPMTFGTIGVPLVPVAEDFNLDGKTDLLWGLNTDFELGINAGGLFVVMNGVAAPVDTAGADRATARDLGTLAGSTSLDEFVNTSVTVSPLDQQDFFKFTITSQQALHISALGAVGQVSLLLQNDQGDGLDVSTADPAVMADTLAPGTYFIGVQHSGGADTNYRLDIDFAPAGPSLGVLQGFDTVTSAQPAAIDYGTFLVATTDTHKTFTLRNDGSTALNFGTIALPTGFSIVGTAPATTLAPGAATTLTVDMDVTTAGDFAGDINIASDDSNTPHFLIPVTGSVTELPTTPVLEPVIAVTQDGLVISSGQQFPVSIGFVAQNGTPLELNFTVSNTGTAPLTISNFLLPGNLSLVEPLSTTIAAGASDDFTVKMKSTAVVGAVVGNITFTNDSGGVSNVFALPIITHVTGIVVQPPDLSGAITDVLVGGKLSVTAGGQAIPGDSVTLKLHVDNSGAGALAAGTYNVAISTSADQILDAGDRLLQTSAVKLPAIAAGGSADVSVIVPLPKDIAAGSVFFLADLDSTHTLTESNENNNTAVSGTALPVVLQAGQVGTRANVRLVLQTADGTLVTFAVKSGTAVVTVDPNTGAMDLDITGNGAALTITSKTAVAGAPNQVVFRNVTINGVAQNAAVHSLAAVAAPALSSFIAKNAQITGTFDAPAGLKTLTLQGADGATINIGPAASPTATLALTLGKVKNTSLNSQMNLKSLTAINWLDNDQTADVITAPSIGSVKINGDKKTALLGDFQADLALGGAPVTTLKSLTATGAITGVNWDITGAVGAITATRLIDSVIHVGVNPGVLGLPALASNFDAADALAAIKSFTLKGIKGSVDPDFVNSIIAAKTIGTASLGRIAVQNAGTAFGLAARTMGAITSLDATGKKIKRNPAGAPLPDVDFFIRVL